MNNNYMKDSNLKLFIILYIAAYFFLCKTDFYPSAIAIKKGST